MNNLTMRKQLRLYFVMGSVNCKHDPVFVLEQAIKGGITLFQYREKGSGALQDRARLELGMKLRERCRTHHIPFIVNDDIELALALDADGLHIGQEDGLASEARDKLGQHQLLGVSAHNMEEAKQAVEDGADYIGVGPIYPTSTKTDARQVQGTSIIASIREQLPQLPIVGIGGITRANGLAVLQSGADGLAVVSAISAASDPYVAARELCELEGLI